jgi:hypothetical protein
MKHKRTLITIVVVVVASFGLGFAAARKGPEPDKKEIVMADDATAATTNSPTEQTFPKNWGRLVNYVFDETSDRKLFVFEAEDGTIRAVRTRLDWNNHLIASTDVITIGRK